MTKTRVGIIGGGLAGLTTAYKLSKENFLDGQKVEITLLEATSYIGGRVRTLRNFASNGYAEVGALSLCDNEYEIQELIKELKLELVDQSIRGSKRFYSSDGLIPWGKSEQSNYFKKYILNNIPKSIDELNSTECIELDNISMLDFIKQKVLENNKIIETEKKDNADNYDAVIDALKVGILGLYSDDFSKLSALNGLRWINQYTNSKKSFSIKGGNDRLPEALEKAVKENGVKILRETAVVKITRPSSYTDSHITLTIVNSDKQRTLLEFDYVVVATPLSAFQKRVEKCNENCIEFEPSLPEDRRKAVENIQYNCSIARIYFEFNNQFWLDDKEKTAMTIINKPTIWIEDHTNYSESKTGILEVHASSEAGKLFHKNNSIELAKKELENVWGECISKNLSSSKPVEYFWNEDFYQKGAYPYLGLGQAHYPNLLSQPLRLLSFAGEYTDIFSPASMNGAIKSALRVVNEVKSELSAKKDLSKNISQSKNPYSFWLKSGAIIAGITVGVAALYKMTRKI